MELKSVIENRRSIRHFNNEKLEKEKIIEILNAGILAPSAHNKQPWHFIVVNKQDIKQEISNLLKEKTEVSTNLTSEVIKECQSLILIFAEIENDVLDIQSVGACIENMILQATDLKVGSLWIGYILEIEHDIKEMFKCNKKFIGAVALGYTDTFPSARPRKKLEEVSTWYEE